MSALQALEHHLQRGVLWVGVYLLVVECGGDVYAACAADDELTPRLRVEVEQYVAVELIVGQCVGTEHARLLICRDEGLHRAMHQVLGLHDGHDGGHAQSIVRTERSVLGLHPVAVDVCLYGVGLEVVRAVLGLLGHHVHVCLQDDALAALHPCRGRLAHDDVSCAVLECLHAGLGGEVEQEMLDFLKMS